MLAEAARRQAEVEADLHILQLQKEASAACIEAEVYQAAIDWEDKQRLDFGYDEERAQCTREYVFKTTVPHAPQPFPEPRPSHEPPSHPQPPTSPQHPLQPCPHGTNNTWPKGNVNIGQPISPPPVHPPPIRPAATLPTPARKPPSPFSYVASVYNGAPPPIPDFTTYLIRREMVSSGLTQFDDRPENY